MTAAIKVDSRYLTKLVSQHTYFIENPISVLPGVSQSLRCLGVPHLFNLFINVIILVLNHSNILVFADDAKLFKLISYQDTILFQKNVITLIIGVIKMEYDNKNWT